jgi:pimeloyl-ACP methyl ester carboxylesterase
VGAAGGYENLLDFDVFEWNGYKINHAISKSKSDETLDVLLVHGFGASIGHWKKNIVELVKAGHTVHAIDLLGFGASEKPLGYDYTMEGWRDLLVSYLREKVLAKSGKGKVVIIGNSIGSLASLLTAQELVTSKAELDQLKGVVLMNCAGGMNNAATLDDDWRVKLAYPIFALINALLKIKPVAEFLFNKFRNKETIESVLRQVYGDKDSVDEDLVDLIHGPSCTPGALEAFVSILTGPPGPRPEQLMPELLQAQVPLLVMWGEEDPFTPLDGPVGKYFLDKLSGEYDFVTKQILPSTGHCPHDDRPELVHDRLIPWLSAL